MAVTGQQAIANNIIRYGGGFINHVNKVMGEVSEMLDKAVTINMSLRDHSPSDLAKLGHPYAKRHGPKGKGIHTPYWQVHEQTGKLMSSKRSGTIDAKIQNGKLMATAYTGLDESKAPHAAHVVFGTSKMIPRPVLRGSLAQVEGKSRDKIRGELRDLTVRFNPK